MKQKDIALILVIIFISAIISFFASKAIFAAPKDRQQQVEVVQPITSEFSEQSKPEFKRYFNKQAFNPTKLITISQNANPGPFKSPSTQ